VTARQVTVSSPAKINLSLGVGAVRPDGFHSLATVYQALGLRDEVTVRSAAEHSIAVVGDGVDVSHVPADESNLALRAAMLLADHHGVDRAVEVRIRKRIPVAGGLAGGSTDAAAALVACDVLWEVATPREELVQLAAELGSDVPFCLVGGTATGRGRGELVTPVRTTGTYWWVVVPADDGLSTPAVYRRFDELAGSSTVADPELPPNLLAALSTADVAALGAALTNDLQQATMSLRPDLFERLRVGLQASAHGAIVSGSGPTTVFLCGGRAHADRVSAALLSAGADQALVVQAPAPGAQVTEVPR
jgi:4-diphosphocytidyl-2-C-methyl-D-erythritol kinase